MQVKVNHVFNTFSHENLKTVLNSALLSHMLRKSFIEDLMLKKILFYVENFYPLDYSSPILLTELGILHHARQLT